MILRLNGNVVVENLRNYPVEIVEKLQALLASGAQAYPDPHRQDFYDLENCSRVFFIHICPNGKVLLLASWLTDGARRSDLKEDLAATTMAHCA